MAVYQHQLLAPGTWAIEQGHVRIFLLEGEKEALLFDCGNPGGELAAYVAKLTRKPLTVVISHAHGDHLGAVRQFPFAYLHPADFQLLPAITGRLLPLVKGQAFDLGGRVLETIEIPGHTPGSIALLDRANRMLFSGDTLQTGPIYMFMPTCSLEQFIGSMRRLQALAPEYDQVYACHNRMPVTADLIPDLMEGAALLRDGKLEGKTAKLPGGRTMTVYHHGQISFFG